MNKEEEYREILRRHLPADAVEWVYNYFTTNNVYLHITRQRTSKLGDYRWPQPRHNYHEISVNGDLNPYMFLWVFMHEAAHMETHLKYGNKKQPHGHEWQAEYARLMREHIDLFPTEARATIALYASHIPFVRATGQQVEEMLRRHDPDYKPENDIHLDDLSAGSLFRLKSNPAILFRADQRRRTRWLCTDTATGREYSVRGAAEVLPQ